MHDIVFAFGRELFARCVGDTEDIASELDRHHLRAEADTEKWDFFLSRILGCHDHPLDPAIAESSWYHDRLQSLKYGRSL